MKIDQQYLKDLLIAFEDTHGPDTLLSELENTGFSREDSNFIFHMRLLSDYGLIVRVMVCRDLAMRWFSHWVTVLVITGPKYR